MKRPIVRVHALDATRVLLLNRQGESLCSFTGEDAVEQAQAMAEEINEALQGDREAA